MLYYKLGLCSCCSFRLNNLYKECLLLRFEEVRQNYVRLLLVLPNGREEQTLRKHRCSRKIQVMSE